MSNLTQIKQSVGQIAKQAKVSAGDLARFSQAFNRQVGAVDSLIGGSSQQADRKVSAALQQAAKAVNDASGALQEAARVAEQYAHNI